MVADDKVFSRRVLLMLLLLQTRAKIQVCRAELLGLVLDLNLLAVRLGCKSLSVLVEQLI